MYARSIAIAAALATACSTVSCEMSTNGAISFEWRGYADTTLPFENFFNEDHTVLFRFMPKLENAYHGVMLGDGTGGIFIVGQADFDAAYRVTGKRGRILMLQVGDVRRYYDPLIRQFGTEFPPEGSTIMKKGLWHHLAVTRTNQPDGSAHFRLFYNGRALAWSDKRITDGPKAGMELVLPAGARNMPRGNLRLGNRNTGLIGGKPAQFYGHIDDIYVFKRAFTGTEISAINQTGPIIEPWQVVPDPTVFSLTLDYEPHYLPQGTFTRGSFLGEANAYRALQIITVLPKEGLASDPGGDARSFLRPTHETVYRLPFEAGVVWRVGQPTDNSVSTGSSHKGFAAFCLDMTRYEATTAGSPIHAYAPGVVQALRNDGLDLHKDDGGMSNFVNVLHHPELQEMSSSIHFQMGSVPVEVGETVDQDTVVGAAGRSGTRSAHLHTGAPGVYNLEKKSTVITRSWEFSDFFIAKAIDRTDFSKGHHPWCYMEYGLPDQYDLVQRNPVDVNDTAFHPRCPE